MTAGPRIRRRLGRVLALALGALALSAHVGTNTVVFEGPAGAYPIRVTIRPPTVVPGLADIAVRVLSGTPARITVQPFRWDAGDRGAPPPDEAIPVPGEPSLYSAELWLMTRGAYSVHVTVEGEGGGTAIVPLNSWATAVRTMPRSSGAMLLALGAFLLVGAVTIVGAAVRESVLAPGETPTGRHRSRAALAMAGAAVVLVGAMFLGNRWWGAVDRAARNRIFRPLTAVASVRDTSGARWLDLAVRDPRWRGGAVASLVPDHGKLMHLFVARDDFAAFAHLHPVPLDSNTFTVPLPGPLPAGSYRVYADIVTETGFAYTLADTVGVPSGAGEGPSGGHVRADADDSWLLASPAGEGAGAVDTLGDGSIMTWDRPGALSAGTDAPLTFIVSLAPTPPTRPSGDPPHLEPYMGMLAHAAVAKSDGSVFAHLHPVGTISMASLRTFQYRTAADTVAGQLSKRIAEAEAMSGMATEPTRPTMGTADTVTIPFEFPSAGRYRVWVQVRRAGRVLTGAFDAEVGAR